MDDYEKATGGRVLAIEHNPNLSGGLMFAPQTVSGKPFDASYAAMRARFDRLVEVSQSKGDSETTPQLSPHDQFADFERWNKGNVFGLIATTSEMLPYNYVRSALKLGLLHAATLGVDPFKLGFVGGSDQHTSLSTTRAENYFGVGTIAEPKPGRWKEPSSSLLSLPSSTRICGKWHRAASPVSGHARTRAKPSGTPSIARKSLPPAARVRRCVSSAAGTSRRRSSPIPTPSGSSRAMPMASRWAAT